MLIKEFFSDGNGRMAPLWYTAIFAPAYEMEWSNESCKVFGKESGQLMFRSLFT